MSPPIVVLSRDGMRGSILKKILAHNGYQVLWIKSFHDAQETLGGQVARIVIFDAKGLYAREADLLHELCVGRAETRCIVLAEESVIPTYEARGLPSEQCLPEPFDPELVVSRVKELLSRPPPEKAPLSKPVTDPGQDTLTDFLKQFLKLD